MSNIHALFAVVRGVRRRRLSVAACRLLATIRIVEIASALMIRVMPLTDVRRMLARLGPIVGMVAGSPSQERVEWALDASARVSAGGCLARALAGALLLEHCGQAATVVIGVAVPNGERLESHAWLESNGRPLIARHEALTRFVPIAAWADQP